MSAFTLPSLNDVLSATPAFILPSGRPKTVIVTSGARGIGGRAVRAFHTHGCNVVIADLPSARHGAEFLIASLEDSDRVLFHGTDITNWQAILNLFRTTREIFGQIDIVTADAGLMENRGFFEFDENENGEIEESAVAYDIIDVHLKGSMNSMSSLDIGPGWLTWRKHFD